MKAVGFPIVGDNIYGTAGERLMLHAQTLNLLHPITGEPMQLECPAPF
jgi:tRNA pseudouridine32 synthase/23S rRNA pseudouridine746 synthase